MKGLRAPVGYRLIEQSIVPEGWQRTVPKLLLSIGWDDRSYTSMDIQASDSVHVFFEPNTMTFPDTRERQTVPLPNNLTAYVRHEQADLSPSEPPPSDASVRADRISKLTNALRKVSSNDWRAWADAEVAKDRVVRETGKWRGRVVKRLTYPDATGELYCIDRVAASTCSTANSNRGAVALEGNQWALLNEINITQATFADGTTVPLASVFEKVDGLPVAPTIALLDDISVRIQSQNGEPIEPPLP
jgi:hypothetical protein